MSLTRVEEKIDKITEHTQAIRTDIAVIKSTLNATDPHDMRRHVDFVRKLPKVFMWIVGFIGGVVAIFWKFTE